jgi:hypothetical protein
MGPSSVASMNAAEDNRIDGADALMLAMNKGDPCLNEFSG